MAIIQIKQKKKRPINKKILLIVIAVVVVLAVALGGFLWWRHEQSRERAEELNSIDLAEYSGEGTAEELKEATGIDLQEVEEKTPQQSSLGFLPEYYAAARLLSARGEHEQSVLYFEAAEQLMDNYSGKNDVAQDFYWDYMWVAIEAEDWDTALRLADLAEAEVNKNMEGEELEIYLDKLKFLRQDIQEAKD